MLASRFETGQCCKPDHVKGYMVSASRRHIRQVSCSAGVALALFYIVFHSFTGDHGLFAMWRKERQIQHYKVELSSLQDERNRLEHKVTLLGNANLDLDLLDEQVKRNLGLLRKGEVILLLDNLP